MVDHLGNVTVQVSDEKDGNLLASTIKAKTLSYQQYFPFGWEMPGRSLNPDRMRFTFNGKELDDKEWGMQDYGMRIYDNQVGRFLSFDPIASDYPELTPYQFSSNTPIEATDLDGLEKESIKAKTPYGFDLTIDVVTSSDNVNIQIRPHTPVPVHTRPIESVSRSIVVGPEGNGVATTGTAKILNKGYMLAVESGHGSVVSVKEGYQEGDPIKMVGGAIDILTWQKDIIKDAVYDQYSKFSQNTTGPKLREGDNFGNTNTTSVKSFDNYEYQGFSGVFDDASGSWSLYESGTPTGVSPAGGHAVVEAKLNEELVKSGKTIMGTKTGFTLIKDGNTLEVRFNSASVNEVHHGTYTAPYKQQEAVFKAVTERYGDKYNVVPDQRADQDISPKLKGK